MAAAAAWRRLAGLPEPDPDIESVESAPSPVLIAAGDGPTDAQIEALSWMERAANAVAGGRPAPPVPRLPITYWKRAHFERDVAEGWLDDDNFVLFKYMPSMHMVKRFKDGEPAAMTEVATWMLGTLPGLEPQLRAAGCRYVLTPPGRMAGRARGSAEALCAVLATAFPWLQHLPGGLERTETVTSRYHDHIAPGLARHLETIRFVGEPGADATKPNAALLFDDVFRDGATSEACRRKLKKALGVDRVFGLFVSRTSASWPPSPLVKVVATE